MTFPRHHLRLRALAGKLGEAETLIEVQAELAELETRRRNLVARRGVLIRRLIEAQGWKFVARMLSVGHSRVYAMSARKPTTQMRSGGALAATPETPPPATPKEQAWRAKP